MCGIVGIVAQRPFTSHELLSRLKRLEYRGYDSYGYWNGKTLTRQVGKIQVADDHVSTCLAISHTRWATHGGVEERNAHPHRSGDVTIVHNGIIENYEELRAGLIARGAVFSSQTDSEVIAQFVRERRARGDAMPAILREALTELRGTFAALITLDGDETLYVLKRDSPLAIGLAEGRFIVASDLYAFGDVTQRAVFLENNEYGMISADSFAIFDDVGASVHRAPVTFPWTHEEGSKERFAHFMRKEIHEVPEASRRLVTSLATDQRDAFAAFVDAVRSADKVVFTAAGTAYHAALLGASMLHECGRGAQAIIASEFESFVTITSGTLVIAVSQSGETMDVIEALKYARERGASLASVVNVPYSTIERMCARSLQIHAGPEVAVASTKAFTNQAILLLALAQAFGYRNGLQEIPDKLRAMLAHEETIVGLAQARAHAHDLYVIGRRLGYPLAREFALKIKEVSYIHAEGMMAGELKHGTIALIEEGTPVVALVYGDDARMRGSVQELRARGADVITVGTMSDANFAVPAASEAEFMLLAAIVGQLLAYHLALARGCPIDQPRNLAKSVTVL